MNRDVRLSGFADRAPLARAWEWLDAASGATGHEAIPSENAAARVLAADMAAPADLPPADTAAVDGYAVRAAGTEGAGAYNPLPLAGARVIAAGDRLPAGCDAVLAFDAASSLGPGRIEALDAVAPGEGVLWRGSLLPAGAAALPAGRRLRPQDLALLRVLGIALVPVVRRPLVRLAIPGPKGVGAEALGPMLDALIRRDGGNAVQGPLAAAIAAPGEADLILVAGRSSVGEDDMAASALREAGGDLALHGIALRPGGSSGLGRLGGRPVLLLPGDPLACLAAYELLAGRLVRRMAGLPADLPQRVALFPLARKIVSAIGFTDVVQISIASGTAVPVGSVEGAGLPAACRADGFVVVPDVSEGYAEGETIAARLYGAA